MNYQQPLDKMRKFFRQYRRLPTYKEMADMMGFASKNAAFKLANKLIEAGYVEKDYTGKLIPRRLFSPMGQTGFIVAGFPVPAEELPEDMVSFDEMLITHPEATFMLSVSGDSMIEAGILNGDKVIVDRILPVKDGDVVAALMDGELTLKYYRKIDGRIALVPANKDYPTLYPEAELIVAGVVTSVIRKLH